MEQELINEITFSFINLMNRRTCLQRDTVIRRFRCLSKRFPSRVELYELIKATFRLPRDVHKSKLCQQLISATFDCQTFFIRFQFSYQPCNLSPHQIQLSMNEPKAIGTCHRVGTFVLGTNFRGTIEKSCQNEHFSNTPIRQLFVCISLSTHLPGHIKWNWRNVSRQFVLGISLREVLKATAEWSDFWSWLQFFAFWMQFWQKTKQK